MAGSSRKACQKTKTSVDTLSIVEAVDDVLSHYFEQCTGFDYFSLEQNEQKSTDSFMHSEKLTLCEMNVELWDVALTSALMEISLPSYPHTATMKALINCILNDYGDTDFATITEILNRLLLFHPPYTDDMRSYYKKLLHDQYAQISEKGPEKEPFFWVLLELLGNIPPEVGKPGLTEWDPPRDEELDCIDVSFNSSSEGNLKEKLRDLVHKKTVVHYEKLSKEKQYMRSSICFKFFCDLLERDLFYNLKKFKAKSVHVKCLLSNLIWSDTRHTGQMTPKINKIINLLFKRAPEESVDLYRLLSMVAVLVNYADRLQENEYPFLGTSSLDLARAVALLLLERAKVTEDELSFVSHLMAIKPCWFRLLCCCHVVGALAGFHCLPELPSVVTVMEHILQIVKGQKKENERRNVKQSAADPDLVAKYSKLKSVNIKYRSGHTRLHKACRKDKPDEVVALLTFTQLDVNLTDTDGWTALHTAATFSSVACAKELLSFCPRLGSVQRPADTRARGPQNYTPLMLAVQNGHLEICNLLLQHTGSVLLEDITDDNETAFEFCEDEEIRRVLTHYKKNHVKTIHSRKRLHLITDNLSLMVRLCSVLAQSYMGTHRTWEVYHKMKAIAKSGSRGSKKPEALIQYSRYHRDLKTNLPRLRALSAKLKRISQLLPAADELHCLFSLNKS